MRLFNNLDEALSEIQRDLAKGPKVVSTRVQQRIDQELPGRELLAYSYTIEKEGVPVGINDIIKLGQKYKFPPYFQEAEMRAWLREEGPNRVWGSLGYTSD